MSRIAVAPEVCPFSEVVPEVGEPSLDFDQAEAIEAAQAQVEQSFVLAAELAQFWAEEAAQ